MSSQQFGQYKTIERIGSGTVGSVPRAVHTETGAEVAIKLLNINIAEHPDIDRRFVREVAILQKLDHENVVRHIDCGVYDDGLYCVLELVPCGTLAEVLEAQTVVPWQSAVAFGIQICDGLEAIHDRGIVHRDIKPTNLFLSDDGRIKIGDFGIALDTQADRLTLEGVTVGTVSYMSPEQIRGLRTLTGQTDLYALGCILFQLVAGDRPYRGETTIDVCDAQLHAPIPSVRSYCPDAPEDLEKLVSALLAKDVDDRIATAADARTALNAVLSGQPIPKTVIPQAVKLESGTGTNILDNTAVMPAETQSYPAVTDAAPTANAPSGWIQIVLAVLCVAGLGLLVLYLLGLM